MEHKKRFVEKITNMKEKEITKTNNYQYMDKVCFIGYLARECFGNVYNPAGNKWQDSGLVKLENELAPDKWGRIVFEHLHYIHNNITFEEAKKNVLKILNE